MTVISTNFFVHVTYGFLQLLWDLHECAVLLCICSSRSTYDQQEQFYDDEIQLAQSIVASGSIMGSTLQNGGFEFHYFSRLGAFWFLF